MFQENSATERNKCYYEPESGTDDCKYVMGGFWVILQYHAVGPYRSLQL
jgi:hypothetical protein